MAALLESVLRGEERAGRAVRWIRGGQENGNEVLANSSIQRKDFVPFLLNFLREQASHILANGPSTPAKTPTSKGLRTPGFSNERRGCRGGVKGASRVQLFSPGHSRSPVELSTPGSHCLSGVSALSSPSCSSVWSSAPRSSAPERRSTQRASLGDFLVSPSEQPLSQRRGRRRSGGTPGGAAGRQGGHSLNEEQGRWDSPLSSAGRRNGTCKADVAISPPPPPQLNLNNMDDFPPVGASPTSPGTKPSRRINPTPVSAERPLSKPKNCFTSTPLSKPPTPPAIPECPGAAPQGGTPSSLQEERELLRRERSKLAQQSSSPVLPALDPCTPTKPGSRMSTRVQPDSLNVCADIANVSFSTELDLLAQLYCTCIAENLVPSVFLELFFVLQLLTSRGPASLEDKGEDTLPQSSDVLDRHYLRNLHNCVYFAVRVLENQFELVSHLDRCILRLLAENERVGSFSPLLRDRLVNAYENSTAKVSPTLPPSIQSVSFQPATDNRSNFSNDKAFHTFKKQRDIFYELLREWEDCHKEPGWDFERVLGIRIRTMVNQLTAAGNHSHFARLFQKQLIQMCKGSQALGSGGEAPDTDLLGILGTDNLSRLKRLQERFIQPQGIIGPCPPPSFPGHQEFFKEFLQAASSCQLNQHLTDSLCQQILELDSIAILGPGSAKEEGEGEGDMEQQDEKLRFASVLTTARLLAKFLGFITFLPYQMAEPPAREIQEAAVTIRNMSAPVLDVCAVLRCSVEQRRAVLTVPWLVEFLSMVDYTAPFLLHYRSVFTMLIRLYRRMVLGRGAETSYLNQLLIVAVLGWLFQIPAFPEDLFFGSDFEKDAETVEKCASSQGLDCLPLVDQHLLYTCCPYLSEFRKLLAAFVAGSTAKNGGLIRKITPTSAESIGPPTPLSQQKLQAELEQAFFHNQPPSLRRTVEFVSERVGSNCVKHIKATLVSELVRSAEAMLREGLTEDQANVLKLRDSICTQLCERGRQALDHGRQFCSVKGPEAVRVLLPEETSAAVLRTSEDITVRLSTEKACTWLSANIAALIKRELKNTFDRVMKTMPHPSTVPGEGAVVVKEQPPTKAKETEEGEARCPLGCQHRATLPSDIIIEIKEVLSIAVGPRSEGEHLGSLQLLDLLTRLRETLHCRKFISPVPEQMLARCTVLLASKLVSGDFPLGSPALPQAELAPGGNPVRALLELLISLWRLDFSTPPPLRLLFTEHNLTTVFRAGDTQWGHFLFLTGELLEKGLLGQEEVAAHWKGLSELPWPTKCMEKFEGVSVGCLLPILAQVNHKDALQNAE
ncbi:codanin-1 isoform X2 [Amia ocellicauda]|uniref:codanin-1 isoform X2 n=1 Tax=Amia ocellicauda TaxID=2972642 RepID=UPI003463FB7C